MKNLFQRSIRAISAGAMAGVLIAAVSPAWASSDVPHIERQTWTFGGITGGFDREQLRRGHKVYKDVCAACHSMKRVYYRNLMQPGGPEYTKEEAEAFAAEAQITDGPERQGRNVHAFR